MATWCPEAFTTSPTVPAGSSPLWLPPKTKGRRAWGTPLRRVRGGRPVGVLGLVADAPGRPEPVGVCWWMMPALSRTWNDTGFAASSSWGSVRPTRNERSEA